MIQKLFAFLLFASLPTSHVLAQSSSIGGYIYGLNSINRFEQTNGRPPNISKFFAMGFMAGFQYRYDFSSQKSFLTAALESTSRVTQFSFKRETLRSCPNCIVNTSSVFTDQDHGIRMGYGRSFRFKGKESGLEVEAGGYLRLILNRVTPVGFPLIFRPVFVSPAGADVEDLESGEAFASDKNHMIHSSAYLKLSYFFPHNRLKRVKYRCSLIYNQGLRKINYVNIRYSNYQLLEFYDFSIVNNGTFVGIGLDVLFKLGKA